MDWMEMRRLNGGKWGDCLRRMDRLTDTGYEYNDSLTSPLHSSGGWTHILVGQFHDCLSLVFLSNPLLYI